MSEEGNRAVESDSSEVERPVTGAAVDARRRADGDASHDRRDDRDGAAGDVDPQPADPLSDDSRVVDLLGPAYPVVARFHELLTAEGVLRGLIGPREVPRLWERHLLNSAALVPYLPTNGLLVDVGSGAGLPGVVLAAMLPDVEVVLLEPMERRVDWLTEVVDRLSLDNAVVRRGRAEEAHGVLTAQAVTARAVAPMDRLARWTLPLLEVGGVLVTLKGRQAAEEIAAARHVLKKLGAGPTEIHEATTLDGLEPTTVVRIARVSRKG